MLACTIHLEDIDVMECRGDLNVPAMVTLKNKLRRLMEKDRTKVILDLSQTHHVDLAALGILVERIKEVRSAHGDIKLCNMTSDVQRTFKMVGVSKVIDAFATRTEAVRSFQLA